MVVRALGVSVVHHHVAAVIAGGRSWRLTPVKVTMKVAGSRLKVAGTTLQQGAGIHQPISNNRRRLIG